MMTIIFCKIYLITQLTTSTMSTGKLSIGCQFWNATHALRIAAKELDLHTRVAIGERTLKALPDGQTDFREAVENNLEETRKALKGIESSKEELQEEVRKLQEEVDRLRPLYCKND